MKLKLMWTDTEDNVYELGILEEKENMYYFDIEFENLKQATGRGCMGIGSLNLLDTHFESEELFSFFKNRIPEEDHPRLKEYLEKYNLTEYNEMELLKSTYGMLGTDRYFVEEV